MTERLYYRDADLLDFSARVTAIGEAAGRPAIQLDRTAFYPTAGGQPHDTGTLGPARVVEVVEAGPEVLHLVDGPLPEIGAIVVGRIDRARRIDHTQQHTGQHVLSQAFERTGGLHTLSFHLGAASCTIDLDRTPLTAEEVRAAEELANQVVLEDRPVLIHVVPAEEVARFGVRKPTTREGEIRVVEVEEFDRSACGGTHVRRTGQIGPIKVRRWERRGATTRVEFLCGVRALRDYGERMATTRSIADRLSVADADLGPAVGRLLDEAERLRAEVRSLRAALLEREAGDLLQEARLLPGARPLRLVRRQFADRSAEELKHLALLLAARGDVVALLGSTGERRHLVFAQSPGLPFDLGALLRRVAPLDDLRGGGSHDLAQAGSPAPGSLDAALDAAEVAIWASGTNGPPAVSVR